MWLTIRGSQECQNIKWDLILQWPSTVYASSQWMVILINTVSTKMGEEKMYKFTSIRCQL